jgi:hypothetical protein
VIEVILARRVSNGGSLALAPYVHSTPNRGQSRSTAATDLPNRIEQLEQLVVSLMSAVDATKLTRTAADQQELVQNNSELNLEHTVDENTESPAPSQLSQHFGQISLESTETSHWSAVLDGVQFIFA